MDEGMVPSGLLHGLINEVQPIMILNDATCCLSAMFSRYNYIHYSVVCIGQMENKAINMYSNDLRL